MNRRQKYYIKQDAERAKKGLCRKCGKNRCKTGWRCEPCKAIRRATARERLAVGLCVTCKGNNDTDGSTCSQCRKRRNARLRKTYSSEKVREKALCLKGEAFDAYGGRCCACCGESIIEFLQIDHVANNGGIHRKEIGKNKVGVNFYKWLKRNGYPPGYQVLCANCNIAKTRYGQCPHQRGKR